MGIADRDLRAHLLAGRPAVSGWCMVPAPILAELVAMQPFDALTVDLQHGLIDYAGALAMLQAANRTGIATLCRLPWNEPGIAGKLLDAGFGGVICPMVDTADDAARLVRACRYPPLGARSYGPTRARRLHGDDYGATSNARVTVLAMIETAAGLANLGAILATDGIDGVYIGPADLALSLGHPPSLTSDVPEVVAAINTIRDRARAMGKVAGIHCGTGAASRDRLAEGFTFVALGTDVSVFERAMARELAAARGPAAGRTAGEAGGQY